MGRGRKGGKQRRYPGVHGRRPDLKSLRQSEAKERAEVRTQILAKLSLKEDDARRKWSTSKLQAIAV